MKTDLKTGTLYLTISSFIFIISGYLVNIFLGRFLGPSLYGTYGVLISIISVLNILQASGFTQSASKFIAENEEKADSIFYTTFRIQNIFTIVICLSLFFSSDRIAAVLRDPSLSLYLKLSCLIFPLYGFYALLVDYSNGMHRFKKQALINIVYSISKLILILFLGFLYKLSGVIFAFIISPLFAILSGFYYPSNRSYFPYKKLLLFSLPLIAFALLSTLLQSVDLYFVKSMLSDENSGYYTASQNISKLIFFATVALSGVLLPSISHSFNHNLFDRLRNTIRTALRLILFFVIPGAFLISGTSKEIIHLIYSETYIHAANSLSILSFGIAFYSVFFLLCTILNGAGKPVISTMLSLIGVVTNALFCYFLIPFLSISGAAIASTTSNLVVLIIAGIIVLKKFQVLVPLGSGLKMILGSLIIYGIATQLELSYLLLPLEYLVLFCVYLGFLFITKEITKENIKLVKSMIPSFITNRLPF